jgi:hypothetical protein
MQPHEIFKLVNLTLHDENTKEITADPVVLMW